ncbi:hypothetical protein RHODO2019_14475 [Rhodococcus antarcticus]|uniref:Uncharacterized protein n=1 Tax=Rhodococcus antarcticus TaxID=2987751 RepID=A0ABY6NZ94_9NOCA|nr:hypothetical protein [Rhodococcus antarcticus]UZJ24341.1 hypothetical protein RHODO2019_14475 [Rhodococcus antarcticus]
MAAHPDDLEHGAASVVGRRSSVVARWTGRDTAVAHLLLTSGEAGIDTLDPAAVIDR